MNRTISYWFANNLCDVIKIFRQSLLSHTIVVVSVLLFFTGCKEDDDENEVLEVETVVKLSAETTNVSVYFAQIRLNMQSNKTITEAGILYADHADVKPGDKVYKFTAPFLVSESREFFLEDLLPFKTYYFKGFVVSGDETFYSDEANFVTSQPKIRSVEPLVTGKYGRLTILGENLPYRDVKVFLGDVEVTLVAAEANQMTIRLDQDIPPGTNKKISIRYRDAYTIYADADITIRRFTTLRNGYFEESNNYVEQFYANDRVYTILDRRQVGIYDPEIDKWSYKSIPQENSDPYDYRYYNAFVVNNRPFVGASSDRFGELDLSSFNVLKKTLIPEGTNINGRGVAFSIGGKGYCGMGMRYENGSTIQRPRIYSYDAATDTWAFETEFLLPYGLIDPVVFTIGNEAFFCSGQYNTGTTSAWVKELFSYNVSSKGWTKYADYPGNLSTANIGASYKGKGYVFSGTDIWVFDPQLNSWSIYSQDTLAAPVICAVATDKGIYIGGSGASYFYLFIPE